MLEVCQSITHLSATHILPLFLSFSLPVLPSLSESLFLSFLPSLSNSPLYFLLSHTHTKTHQRHLITRAWSNVLLAAVQSTPDHESKCKACTPGFNIRMLAARCFLFSFFVFGIYIFSTPDSIFSIS